MADLKPCPFCDSRLLSFTEDGTATMVLCGDCSCTGPLGMDEETAAMAWNMRGGAGLDGVLAAHEERRSDGVATDQSNGGE